MNNWITIITFTLPHEAYIAKGRLESEGINTIIKDELTAQVYNFYSNVLGGVKLLINVQILIDGGFIVEPVYDQTETIPVAFKNKNECPYCKSDNFSERKSPGLIMIISLFLFWVPIPIFKKKYYCFDCEKEWKK